jgi:hypothetical protein
VRIVRLLLPSQDTDAPLGDIAEEAQHRSRLWCWAQIVAIVFVGSWRDVRRHQLMALRAIGVGAAVLVLLAMVFEPSLKTLLNLANIVQNTVLGSLDRSQRDAFGVTVFFASVISLFYGGLAVSGWVVGRLHREHGIALVLPFAMLVPLFMVGLALVVRITVPAASQAEIFRSWIDCVKVVAIPVSILIGAYVSTRHVEAA